MEQTLVSWKEDTWTAMDDDMLHWSPSGDETIDETHARLRAEAIKDRTGRLLSTCWVPFRGIVATVACNDGKIRTVEVDRLLDERRKEAVR